MSYVDDLMSTGETVQRSARQHWTVILGSVVVNGLLAAVAVLGSGFFSKLAAQGGPWGRVGLVISALVLLFALYRLIADLATWASKQYVVTTRRVLEIEGVFNKLVRDSNLDKVNDVVLRQSALGRVLGYGDIEIITGADAGVNHLERITDPLGFKRSMLDNKEDFDTIARRSGAAGGGVVDGAAGGAVASATGLGIGTGALSDPGAIQAAIEQLGRLREQGLLTAAEFEAKKAELLSRL
jgi:hypothetical protein